MSRDLPSESTLRLRCRICGKPVSLTSAKTDAEGKAVHDECLSTREIGSDGSDGHATRPRKMVADELSKEYDPKKMIELVTELNEALDNQQVGTSKPKPDGKS